MNESNKKATGGVTGKGFLPGQSGNPAGLKPGTKHGLRARLNAVMRKTPNADILKVLAAKGIELEHSDNAEVIAEVTNREAQKGNMSAIKLIADLTEPKLPTDMKMELNGGEKPIKVLNIIGVLSESGEFIPEAENDPDFN
jgi:hypothetical protein|tara:strand:- start:43 stop:465 length:423 start_codon:yes stop_codon:yes gene_type:complete